MKAKLTTNDLVLLIRNVKKDLVSQTDYLSELDSAFGDGDLGVTIGLGLSAVEEGLKDLENMDVGTLLMRSGLNFNRAASSTFGTIAATALMRAGKQVAHKNEVGLTDITLMLEAAEAGIRERGKAQVGDKTVLDVIVPVKEAFCETAASGETLETAFNKAVSAAEEAVEKTKHMKSNIGRGRWFGEKSLGLSDPGAVALLLMLRSFVSSFNMTSKQKEYSKA